MAAAVGSPAPMLETEVQARVEHVEELLGELDDDPRALAAIQALVELYGEGLRRIVARGELSDELLSDELLLHLLLIHDLHPVDVETRVTQALEGVRPYLGSHGGDVELVGVSDGIARLRLNGTCDGCAASAMTLKHSIETAIMRAAPELEGVEAEGVDEPKPGLLQIGSLATPPGPCLPEPVH